MAVIGNRESRRKAQGADRSAAVDTNAPKRIGILDGALISGPKEALQLISNILESSTEYSIIGKDLQGTILLWNEGARRLYGYSSEDVVGKANSAMLHTPEDV